ncbi:MULTISPECIES: carbohydrate ABC transporter permease [Clostridium]|uniref:Carbohydrate ABC transporter membrane protein 2, CUT1 family n=1 Tax=Clostridium cadaveris TaxID=1529 RepID=A0A1I2MNM9_9CLOT|nr:carbohydrate ABC transporter permease [Clostridium cadaveris]MDU4951035.1 carbohydrate ABC transporter permease [Clostridium sp.]MDM8311636.1 carbohydrate ABC transporter permease [Clostridium cadaveris]MDY4948281.1 carbohydrate ABC transporter permease [Clostridium cadaveris]NME65071.1 carbohydrate ABC transporter permease [Clostridium cadaveris]PWL52996.1 MAG: carbohydrate ABC transporter permease [Clostridium cadaveris]
MKKKLKDVSGKKLYKFFIYFCLILFALSIIVPLGWSILASFKHKSEFYGNPWALPEGFYFENFKKAFVEAHMGEYFLNSIIITGLALAILLVVSIPAAYTLSRFEFKSKKVINTLFTAGLFINVNYIVVPIFLLVVGGEKIVRQIFSLPASMTLFLDSRIVIAIIYAATALPFTIYLLSSYLKSIPKAYEEAAYIDGCGYFKTLIKIIIPMAKPSIITVILFNFLAFWNEYIIALTLLPNGSKTLPLGLINLMQVQKTATDYGAMYAGLVIVMIPTIILYILVQKKLTEGMTIGGIKE